MGRDYLVSMCADAYISTWLEQLLLLNFTPKVLCFHFHFIKYKAI